MNITKQIIKLENKLLHEVFANYLGRPIMPSDYKDIETIHGPTPASYPLIDYYHITHKHKVLGVVTKEVITEHKDSFITNDIIIKFTFKPAVNDNRRTKYCQTSSS